MADYPSTLELFQSTWPADKEKRTRADKLTRLFHSAVPVLKYLDWQVTDTRRGYAETVLPLNIASTNQHITHQAALILIAADYTGGIALSTLLHDVPVVGIHPQSSDYGAYMWGAKADIRWIRPSCADLVCRAEIPVGHYDRIVRRFFRGERVIDTVHIKMANADELVAEANFTYWVQDTQALRKNANDETKIHLLYDHRHKTSARLIAGLRAMEQGKPAHERLFEDANAPVIAGTHGHILAERFCLIAPQLQPMIAARTRHLDECLARFHGGEPYQVINIGAGYDTRIYRLPFPAGTTFFDLDLPSMLKAREEVLLGIQRKESYGIRRVSVPIDLHSQDIHDALLTTRLFDPSLPTLAFWEGGSMYFDRAKASAILRSLRQVLNNPASLLWMDYVHASIITGTTGFKVVEDFIDAMRSLGEPFVNGYNDIEKEMSQVGFRVKSDIPSNSLLSDNDPVFDLYRFCTAMPIT